MEMLENMTNDSNSMSVPGSAIATVAVVMSSFVVNTAFLFLFCWHCCFKEDCLQWHSLMTGIQDDGTTLDPPWIFPYVLSTGFMSALGIAVSLPVLFAVIGRDGSDPEGTMLIFGFFVFIFGGLQVFMAPVLGAYFGAAMCKLRGWKSTWATRFVMGAVVFAGMVLILAASGLFLDSWAIKNGSNFINTTTPGSSASGDTGVVLLAIGAILAIAPMLLIFLGFNIGLYKIWKKQIPADSAAARLRKSKSLLEEALKRGFVQCRTVVCLLVGVAGAGKTHTKYLLFGWAPPEFRNSTSIAERPLRAVRIMPKSGQFQKVDPDQLDKILADTVAAGVPIKKNFIQKLCCICFDNRTENETYSAGIQMSPPEDLPSYGSADWTPLSTYPEEKSCYYCLTEHCCGSNSELQQITKSSLQTTAAKIAATSGSQQFLNCDWVYLIDSGGQIEFLEVLPAFLQHTSVCLFVTKLSETLNEHPTIQYFKEGELVGKPKQCPFTNKEMLMRCVQTIQTQRIHGSTNQGSKLVMVGTHRDLEGQCSESRQQKNEELKQLLCPLFEQSLVYHGQNLTELIFPINCKTPDSQDHEVATELTKVIFNVADSLQPRNTPISWFKFEQHMLTLSRDHNKKMLQREECLQVGKLFHLSEEACDAALDHLANFGVIHYYSHLLPNVVFVDPQFLLGKISELVRYHYQLRNDPNPHRATGSTERKFINEACITLELLKQFPEHYTEFFTPADFLKLMSNQLIVTQLSSDDEYFMPCLLRTMESKEVDQYRETTSSVAPLAIHFSCGLVPHGVFCSLIAFLQSSQNFPSLKLLQDLSEPLCLTRNCIKFELPEDCPGSFTLIDAFSHFEVHVDAPYDVCVSFCPSIQQSLFRGIQEAADTLRYHQLVPKLAFVCNHESTRPHLALPAKAFDYLKCQLNPKKFDHLTEKHRVWCPDKGIHTAASDKAKDKHASIVVRYSKINSQEGTQPLLESHVELDEGLAESTHSVQHNLPGAKVMSPLDSAKCQAFQKCYPDLCDGISDPDWLATELYSKDMISRNLRREIETFPAPTQIRKLLSSVEDQILTSPTSTFRDFLYILHSQPSLEHLARKFEEAYSLTETTHSVQQNLSRANKQNLNEFRAFQSCFAVLSDGISDPGWLASELYSRDMISRNKRQEAENEGMPAPKRTRTLLSAVENQILTNPNPKFGDFLDILHSEPSLEHLARKLEEAYRIQAHSAEEKVMPEVHSEVDIGAQAPTEEEFHSQEMRTSTTQAQAVLEIHSEDTEDCPTVLECVLFQGREKTINIPQEIGTKYYQFGIILLNDPKGTRVSNIKHKHGEDSLQINIEILQEWATGRGKKPVTWETLTIVLRDIELSTLASEIETVKLKSTMI